MEDILRVLIGTIILIFGIPVGNFLASQTRDSLKVGKKYFKALIFIGLIGGFIGLILGNDVLLFTMFFIAIVTSRSLRKNLRKKNAKN